MLPLAKVTIIGNLGRDPELRYTPSGAMSLSFSVAVSKKRGDEELTNWYNVTAWGKLAEILEGQCGAGRFVKGSQAAVIGDLTQRAYTTRDGREGTSLDVWADSVTFNEPRGAAGYEGGQMNIEEVPF